MAVFIPWGTTASRRSCRRALAMRPRDEPLEPSTVVGGSEMKRATSSVESIDRSEAASESFSSRSVTLDLSAPEAPASSPTSVVVAVREEASAARGSA